MLRSLFFTFLFGSAVKGYGKNLVWDVTPGGVGIVGGHDVDIKQYPHQVSVLVYINGENHLRCGGSIIGEEYVLTSFACVSGIESEKLKIRAGSNFAMKDGDVYDVLSVVYHPKLDVNTMDYAVAVIKTKKMSLNGDTAKAAQLPESGSKLKPGDNVVSTGFGLVAVNGEVSKNLQAVSIPVVDLEKCINFMKQFDLLVTERMFCVGFGKSGGSPCDGDVGGPAVSESDSKLYGVHLFGGWCNTTEIPAVHADITVLRDWIKETTGI
ncbi:trypsin-7-like isoform X2 [Plodia interpunctella]|uniref:trypsin-7-like isoform X2 n=1 Tax=Plodia interpunctella TaxID=58824 RepID=UPI002367A334|nr:trypsin-7-like isoform X2 [Plodia interpunctella]